MSWNQNLTKKEWDLMSNDQKNNYVSIIGFKSVSEFILFMEGNLT